MKVPKSWKKVTPVSKTIALVLFILIPFLGIWVGRPYQRAVDSYNTFVNVEPTGVGMQNPINTPTVPMNDNGKILYAHKGDTVFFSLGTVYSWGLSFSDPSVLQPVIVVKGEYKAVKSGVDVVTGNGRVREGKREME